MKRFFLLFVMGCVGDKTLEDTSVEDTGEAVEVEVLITGAAPWDPLHARLDRGDPIAVDAGEDTEMTAVSDVNGTYTFRPEPTFAPGEVVVSVPGADAEQTHTVLPYGRGVFEPDVISGQLYQLEWDTLWFGRLAGAGELLAPLVEGVWLRVNDVQSDSVSFDVLVYATDSEMCRSLATTATLSSEGEFTWSVPSIDLQAPQGEVPMRDISLHGGWLEDGSALGGVEGAVTLHTAVMSQELFVDGDGNPLDASAICDTLASFGSPCHDCVGDGDYCADLRMHGAVLTLDTKTTVPDTIPDCGVDFDNVEDINFECDFPDISCMAVTFGLFGFVGVLRRRRKSHAA